MANELYRTLGVEETATPEDIKRAYYTLLRIHPPEKDPAGFKKIRAAYETLIDEKQRKQYDSIQGYSDEISVLFNEGVSEYENANYSSAIVKFKEIIQKAPDYYIALNYLGMSYMANSEFDRARQVYQELCSKVKDESGYYCNYAKSYLENMTVDIYDSLKLEQAEKLYKKAIHLNPKNTDALMGVATVELIRKNFSGAIEWSEKAINADNQIDIQDFEFFIFQIYVYLFQKDYNEVRRILRKIEDIVPLDNMVIREYVAFQLSVYAAQMFESKIFRVAKDIMDVAVQFTENNDIKKAGESIKVAARIIEENEKLECDFSVDKGVKVYCHFLVAKYFGEYIPNETDLNAGFQHYFANYPAEKIYDSIKIVKSRYKDIYELNTEFFKAFESAYNRLINNRNQSYGNSQQNYSSSSSSTEGCFVATVAFGSKNTPEMQVLYIFRDYFLLTFAAGRLFVKNYYKLGSIVAKWVKTNKLMILFVRFLLLQMIRVIKFIWGKNLMGNYIKGKILRTKLFYRGAD